MFKLINIAVTEDIVAHMLPSRSVVLDVLVTAETVAVANSVGTVIVFFL